MNLFSIPPLASAMLFLLLGVFIFLSNRKSRLNLTFFLICLSTCWWQFSWFILFNIHNEQLALILVRIGYAGILFIPIFFYHFFILFIEDKRSFDRLALYASYFITMIFEFINFFSNYFVKGVHKYFFGFYPAVNFVHLAYLLLLTFVLFRIIFLLNDYLIRNNIKSDLKAKQIKYLLPSMILYGLASFDFTANYGLEVYPIGFIFIVIFSLIIAYSIIKLQLLDVKAIATEIFAVFLTVVSFIEIFTVSSTIDLVYRLTIFVVTLIFAILLIRSVLREVHRREEMEVLNKKLNKVSKDLADANKELKRLDESKSEFLSISSHQLRTPLTIIKGYSSMLMEGSFGKMTKPVKDSVEKIFVSTERLINLVESLLNISRIEAGRIEFKLEPVDLEAVAKSMAADFQDKAKARKLKLLFNAEEKVPKVLADSQKIKDVVSNLIDNAIKYTKQGEIMVGLHQEGTSVVFSSQDTGIGLGADDIGRLFNKFTRGKESNKVNTEGIGLGLYYARVLIENMGGRIWVESPGKGKGSKFSFSLPMADKSKAKKIKT